MMLRALRPRAASLCGLALLIVLAGAGCGGKALPRGTRWVWLVGRPEPAFDPQGPPEPVRWALQRLLSRGLTEQDSAGGVVPAAAASWEWSADSLTLTFRLRPGLVFADGTPCTAGDFRRGLASGLARTDHASSLWLLGAVAGMGRVRAGKPLPALGIEAPDSRTLVLRLSRRDARLPEKLALPGTSEPWRGESGVGWAGARGIGPYRVASEEPGRTLTLLRLAGAAGPDTIVVRFQPVAARVLASVRAGAPDLVWPIPGGLASEARPEGWRLEVREALPRRVLLMVMRADLPPTSRLPARHALTHAVNRDEVMEALGARGRRLETWLPGAGAYEFPALDEVRVRDWMARGKLGQAFHVTLAYDADGAGARVARVLQGGWSRLGIYAELRPLRGDRAGRELLGGLSHVALVEAQSWTDDPAGTLAQLIMPLRGPAAGAFRTGWRTREFDGWIAPGRGAVAPDPDAAQARLREEQVALPLARLPWLWLAREGHPAAAFHPRYGPECAPGPWPRAGGAVTASAP